MYTLLILILIVSLLSVVLILINHRFSGDFRLFYKEYLIPFLQNTLKICDRICKVIFSFVDDLIRKTNIFGHQDAIKENARIEKLGLLTALKLNVRNLISEKFLVESCSRCKEFKMELICFSPNARSVEYLCVNCGKKNYSSAGSPSSTDTLREWMLLRRLTEEYNDMYPDQIFTFLLYLMLRRYRCHMKEHQESRLVTKYRVLFGGGIMEGV